MPRALDRLWPSAWSRHGLAVDSASTHAATSIPVWTRQRKARGGEVRRTGTDYPRVSDPS
jgi:hypothetical protein